MELVTRVDTVISGGSNWGVRWRGGGGRRLFNLFCLPCWLSRFFLLWFFFSFYPISFPELRSPWPAVGKTRALRTSILEITEFWLSGSLRSLSLHMPEMDAPRVFRPLVRENEALGTRLLFTQCQEAPANIKGGDGGWGVATTGPFPRSSTGVSRARQVTIIIVPWSPEASLTSETIVTRNNYA